jgi:hypothetical protein
MSRRVWLLGLVVLTVASVAHVLSPDGVAGQAGYLLATGGAAAVASMGARRHRAPWRFPWMCIAVGVGFSAIGDVAYAVFRTGRWPTPSG